MYVSIKVQKEAKLLELTQEKFQDIRDRYDQNFSTKVLSYQNRILKQAQTYPLDYIMRVPHQTDDEIFRLENQIKNVVMRIVIEIRERKKKPKLKDFIQLYKTKKNIKGSKEEFQKKFKLLYSLEADENEVGEDEKFDKLMGNFDRI
jgi:hypothetical protein